MAKKSRQAKAKHRARIERAAEARRSQQPAAVSTGSQVAAPTPSRAQVAKAQASRAQSAKAQDLASRYAYVIPEVKRIGIIAGALVVVLIIVGFVLG